MSEDFITESRLESSDSLDTLSVREILEIMNIEDRKPAEAVAREIPNIEKAITWIIESFSRGGRLFYIGAGTSGRLGVMDAAECPPTFGTSPEMVQGILAGGMRAFFRAAERAEDDMAAAESELIERHLDAKDVLVGISASGKTPFVLGGIKYAREIGCKTVGITVNPDSPLAHEAELSILIEVGPEVLTGSTRLKSATAQKMVLNMLSTVSMVKSGKSFGNLMVSLKPISRKLEERSLRIISQATSLGEEESLTLLNRAEGDVKVALVMHFTGLPFAQAKAFLQEAGGNVRDSLGNWRRMKKERGMD